MENNGKAWNPPRALLEFITPSKFSSGCCALSKGVHICPHANLTTPIWHFTSWKHFLAPRDHSVHIPPHLWSHVLYFWYFGLLLLSFVFNYIPQIQIFRHPHQSKCIPQPAELPLLVTFREIVSQAPSQDSYSLSSSRSTCLFNTSSRVSNGHLKLCIFKVPVPVTPHVLYYNPKSLFLKQTRFRHISGPVSWLFSLPRMLFMALSLAPSDLSFRFSIDLPSLVSLCGQPSLKKGLNNFLSH